MALIKYSFDQASEDRPCEVLQSRLSDVKAVVQSVIRKSALAGVMVIFKHIVSRCSVWIFEPSSSNFVILTFYLIRITGQHYCPLQGNECMFDLAYAVEYKHKCSNI